MGNNKNGLYKYFDWLEHSVSTWFGVVKSFVFSLMRFAKKYFYSLIYSQSLSGFTKCDDVGGSNFASSFGGLISIVSRWGMLLPCY